VIRSSARKAIDTAIEGASAHCNEAASKPRPRPQSPDAAGRYRPETRRAGPSSRASTGTHCRRIADRRSRQPRLRWVDGSATPTTLRSRIATRSPEPSSPASSASSTLTGPGSPQTTRRPARLTISLHASPHHARVLELLADEVEHLRQVMALGVIKADGAGCPELRQSVRIRVAGRPGSAAGLQVCDRIAGGG
jgi:hypothetical protein